MKDKYFDLNENIERLVRTFNKNRNLFIAFDFDHTVADFDSPGDSFPKMEDLLRFLKKQGFMLILFTCAEEAHLKKRIVYCTSHDFAPDYINENPILNSKKPHYDILLDDKAGLNEAYQILVATLNMLNFNYHYKN